MTSSELDNLVRIGKLKRESPSQSEFDGLVNSAAARLQDSKNRDLSLESRFDLAYNAAHAYSLAALRRSGFRSDNRYVVFQSIPHTLGLGVDVWRVLAKSHELRNSGEYEGHLELNDRIVANLVAAGEKVRVAVEKLPRIEEDD